MKGENKKLLVSVNVLGSVGPIRFLANEDDEVSSVINTTLKAYARQGRIPVLGIEYTQEKIGSMDVTNSLLCMKEPRPLEKVQRKIESKASIFWRDHASPLDQTTLGYYP
ncbi:unnamed protein product [Arabidopsis thaliana]|uniref:Gb/AAC00605.1 n=1 Tax=Arabidopsis thaliana TaxID=3702 RepID=Q9FHP7_ARATH|nr:unnamed protein product [Arabidopsis thaliana]